MTSPRSWLAKQEAFDEPIPDEWLAEWLAECEAAADREMQLEREERD